MSSNKLFCVLLFVFLCMQNVSCEDQEYVVTVQTATQGDMNTLANIVDSVDASAEFTIGAIEGTMTRIQTMGSDYHPATVETGPTLNLINSAIFDSDTQEWTFIYETLPTDPSAELPGFTRLLYFSKSL